MKLAAITGRGTKKDFVDLFFLLKKYQLGQLLAFYQSKYPESSHFLALKSLIYFDDAEKDPDVRLTHNISWDIIRKTIEEQVKMAIS